MGADAAFLALALLLAAAGALWLWRMAPECIVFVDASATGNEAKDIVDAIRHRWRLARVHVLAPGDMLASDMWAPYTPTDAEIEYQRRQGHSTCEAVRLANRWTYSADETHVAFVRQRAQELLRGWRRLLIVGISNGAIPAFDVACHCKASSLWLASGAVSAAQQQRWPDFAGCAVVTAGTQEAFWGGYHCVFAAAPTATHILFQGYHARETFDAIRAALDCCAAV